MQENLKQYLEKHNFSKQLKNLKKKLKDKTVIIYGTGKLFQTIVENYDLTGLNIIAVTDKKYSFDTNIKEEFGYPVIPVEYLKSYYADYIIVATQNYMPVIDFLQNNYCHKYLPLVKRFVWFYCFKNNRKMKKHLTILDHEFILPFTPEEEILYHICTNKQNKLRNTMDEIACRSTAQYIIDNMITVPVFNTPFDLLKYALKQNSLDGMYFEFGVYKGASINFIAENIPNQTIYGFDSFEGLPEAWTSKHQKAHFKMNKLPEVRKNVKLVKGFFDQSLPKFMNESGDFKTAFIHCDSDLYSSAKTIFEYLKHTIHSGTVIVFDEYFNYPGWENGEFKAFQEFIQENNLQYKYLGYVEKGIAQQVAVQIL